MLILIGSNLGCRQYAWGDDDLLPVTESYTNGLDGWGATIVDGLDTMVRFCPVVVFLTIDVSVPIVAHEFHLMVR